MKKKSAPWITGRFCVAPILFLMLSLGLPVFTGCGLKGPPKTKWETPAERQEELAGDKEKDQETKEETSEENRSEPQQDENDQQEPEEQ